MERKLVSHRSCWISIYVVRNVPLANFYFFNFFSGARRNFPIRWARSINLFLNIPFSLPTPGFHHLTVGFNNNNELYQKERERLPLEEMRAGGSARSCSALALLLLLYWWLRFSSCSSSGHCVLREFTHKFSSRTHKRSPVMYNTLSWLLLFFYLGARRPSSAQRRQHPSRELNRMQRTRATH